MKILAEVNALVGQTVAFKIDVTSYVLKYNIHKYGILKLTVDPNVISQLQDNQSSSQISSSQNCSMNIGASEFQSKSSMDDVKRNLVEVYDVEEDSHMSATKVHKSGEVKDANSAEKMKLIIPKLEK
ncbi:hypothetical protein HanLR1_Chr10g0365411 [Helianthus annuus]|nr:hypothetical protein HanLR1_Chr10g0365411 [Helianthus annuus]